MGSFAAWRKPVQTDVSPLLPTVSSAIRLVARSRSSCVNHHVLCGKSGLGPFSIVTRTVRYVDLQQEEPNNSNEERDNALENK